MRDILAAVNEYPWTSFFVFLAIAGIVETIGEAIGNARNKTKEP